jgi:hypothetical protein
VNREEGEPPKKVTVLVDEKVEENKDVLEGSVGEYFFSQFFQLKIFYNIMMKIFLRWSWKGIFEKEIFEKSCGARISLELRRIIEKRETGFC